MAYMHPTHVHTHAGIDWYNEHFLKFIGAPHSLSMRMEYTTIALPTMLLATQAKVPPLIRSTESMTMLKEVSPSAPPRMSILSAMLVRLLVLFCTHWREGEGTPT